MKKYLVSVKKEVCADFELEAETPEEAERKAIEPDGRESMYSDEWCDGHTGSFKAEVVEELP